MATHWTLGCDARDPHRLAAFWALALSYIPEPRYDDPEGASGGLAWPGACDYF
ncbi:hypothetical protein [Kribbella sp. NPDC051718]|uniref:hypothetical protein n=1 Tax=Kribbella sp. NPDC051718 TaxID=3155168 RepID=UPI003419865F